MWRLIACYGEIYQILDDSTHVHAWTEHGRKMCDFEMFIVMLLGYPRQVCFTALPSTEHLLCPKRSLLGGAHATQVEDISHV